MADIKVALWMIVRDWVEARFDHIRVSKFRDDLPAAYPTDHLAKITYDKAGEEIEEIGFVAPKGVLVWRRNEELDKNFDYEMFYATDPEMFNQLESVLVTYEAKRSK